MSQSQQTTEAVVRPIIGELAEFTTDMPLDDEERTTLFKMIRSANVAINNRNIRAIALLATTKTQRNFFAYDPNYDLSKNAVQEDATAKALVILRYLKAVRDDLTNDICYDPHGQLWLLESDFNDHVAKLIAEAMQEVVRDERALLSSGIYPNRDLLSGTVKVTIQARNTFLDLPGSVFGCRQMPAIDTGTDSPHFAMSDEEVDEIITTVKEDHVGEKYEWNNWIKTYVSESFPGPNSLNARQTNLMNKAVKKARLPRERKTNPDGSEVSLWTVGDEKPAPESGLGGLPMLLLSTQGLSNNYLDDAMDELRKDLRKEFAERNGLSIHELNIIEAQEKRRLEEETPKHTAVEVYLENWDAKSTTQLPMEEGEITLDLPLEVRLIFEPTSALEQLTMKAEKAENKYVDYAKSQGLSVVDGQIQATGYEGWREKNPEAAKVLASLYEDLVKKVSEARYALSVTETDQKALKKMNGGEKK